MTIHTKSPGKPLTAEEQRENIRQFKANMAVEGIHLHPEDEALIMRGIDESWSDEEMDRHFEEAMAERGVISPDAVIATPKVTAAE